MNSHSEAICSDPANIYVAPAGADPTVSYRNPASAQATQAKPKININIKLPKMPKLNTKTQPPTTGNLTDFLTWGFAEVILQYGSKLGSKFAGLYSNNPYNSGGQAQPGQQAQSQQAQQPPPSFTQPDQSAESMTEEFIYGDGFFQQNSTQAQFEYERQQRMRQQQQQWQNYQNQQTKQNQQRQHSQPQGLPRSVEIANLLEYLKLSPVSTLEQAEKAYRIMARKAHPDHGGTEQKMKELNGVIARLREMMVA